MIGAGVLLTGFFPFILHKRPITNWAESYAIDPRKIRKPKNQKELEELVKSSEKIRCAGAMHSCAPLIVSEGIILSLENFDKILEINVEKGTAKVQAGVRINDLCNALAPHGLAMGTLGTIDWQTIAGAVMTGTHGGSLTVKSMHTFINSYTLMKANGEVIKITKDSDKNLYSALAPSMGLLGIVTELEVQCVPLEHLEAKIEAIPFEDLEHKFEDVMKSNKYARVVVYPSISKATIWTANPVDPKDAVARGAIRSKGYINFRDENEKAMLEQFLWLCGKKRFAKAEEVLMRVLDSQLDRLNHYVGQYNHVLCKERNNGIPHADIEFNFDFRSNKQVIQAVKKYCDSTRVPYYNFEMRTTQKDDSFLSCCYGRDAMWIDFQAKASESTSFFEDIEVILKPIGFRKHWAKGLDYTDPKFVIDQFPKSPEFLTIVDEFDPTGKFQNESGKKWFLEMSEHSRNLEAQ